MDDRPDSVGHDALKPAGKDEHQGGKQQVVRQCRSHKPCGKVGRIRSIGISQHAQNSEHDYAPAGDET